MAELRGRKAPVEKKNKNKNPLYVVTDKGSQVEVAEDLLEYLFKTFGLERPFEVLKELTEKARNTLTKDLLDQFLEIFIKLMKDLARAIKAAF